MMTLDEYLVQFRSGDESLLRPIEPSVERRTPRRSRRASARDALSRALPPRAFQSADSAYHGARALVGRDLGQGRTLPDFMVIGAAKCGTTSLFDWVCQHPYVLRPMSKGFPRKELLYFDYEFDRPPGWYRAHFPPEADRAQFASQHGQSFLTGEATATYLTHWWAPERAASVVPSAKLIVTLRNPVDRAYSAFHMSKREKLEPVETFEEALALEEARLAPEEAATRADPAYNPRPPAPLGYWSYLQRSRYVEHVDRWLQFFPREQFLFLEFERMAANPQEALDQVYDFLGLPPHRHAEFPQLNAGAYTSMNPDTRAHLVEYFRPLNAQLRERTGVAYGWDH